MITATLIECVLEDCIDRLKIKGLSDKQIDIYSFEIFENKDFIYTIPTQSNLPKKLLKKTSEVDWLGCLVTLSREYLKVLNSKTELESHISHEWHMHKSKHLIHENSSSHGTGKKGYKGPIVSALREIIIKDDQASNEEIISKFIKCFSDEYNDELSDEFHERFKDFDLLDTEGDKISRSYKGKIKDITKKHLKNVIGEIKNPK